jgi:hypothetical protein
MFINLETVKKIASGTAISGGCLPGPACRLATGGLPSEQYE